MRQELQLLVLATLKVDPLLQDIQERMIHLNDMTVDNRNQKLDYHIQSLKMALKVVPRK